MLEPRARVETIARDYRAIALSGKYPKAITIEGIRAAWRSLVCDHPEFRDYEQTFFRVAQEREVRP